MWHISDTVLYTATQTKPKSTNHHYSSKSETVQEDMLLIFICCVSARVRITKVKKKCTKKRSENLFTWNWKPIVSFNLKPYLKENLCWEAVWKQYTDSFSEIRRSETGKDRVVWL